jgi:hypothetical protein
MATMAYIDKTIARMERVRMKLGKYFKAIEQFERSLSEQRNNSVAKDLVEYISYTCLICDRTIHVSEIAIRYIACGLHTFS